MPPKPDPSAAQKERNEYIPKFITEKPFYIPDALSEADYLEHQRLQAQSDPNARKWYDRGSRAGPAATKFRKGACENCGAMTHKAKECTQRPRKKGARWTGQDIQADELVQDVKLGWDAKRDRWNGYDAKEYKRVVEEYEELESLKKAMKPASPDRTGEDGEVPRDDDETKYAEESDMGRQQSTATRQLRLREDTAKYLVNLDLDSAKYDPKTRSMVDSGATQDAAAALVAEENFMRASGDAAEFEKAQKYAWEAQERGDANKQHIQANPTAGELFRKKERESAEARKEQQRTALLDKYGGEQHLQAAPLKDATVTENERYVEYDERGKIKGAPKQKLKSRYKEDILVNNHTSVWGSWWHDFRWGYQCCYSTVKNSYCTGEEGRKAWDEAQKLRTGQLLQSSTDEQDTERETLDKAAEIPIRNGAEVGRPDSEDVVPLKKRTLEEMRGGIGEEEMEEYRRKRTAADDPMASFLGKGELVH